MELSVICLCMFKFIVACLYVYINYWLVDEEQSYIHNLDEI